MHYMGYTYEYFKQALDVLNKYSYVNNVDNLYKEKSLKNRIETRAVRTTMMFTLEKRINDLSSKLKNMESRLLSNIKNWRNIIFCMKIGVMLEKLKRKRLIFEIV